MRIGELAAAVGVTTRTVRHYHHLGLLPEPARRANGYRQYALRHAVVLARIRRLTELGLGLTEVRDVLADDAGKDLADVLTELDEDLARQEAAIRERRRRLRALLDAGEPPAEGPVSPELAAVLEVLPADGSPMAVKDREILALVDTGASPEDRERLSAALRGVLDDPDTVARAREAYALLDALADADPGDPRVERTARALAACVPGGFPVEGQPDLDNAVLGAVYADLAPAQAEAVRRMLEIVLGVER
ncbi:MerR family transcriptional regulator [Streptomyces lavenduligriseus]|uniref:MerR family transcriptional regulator n=1 Tax=Streptomyces lavenduligriseus TaxID=67315 RepID=A0ABT0P547_9ACTN|nr:MerR family transcriptional regulator [Streptomyces lavenduligriseus]MCL3998691.1 MerR family transcriptional regulator [Streptomyces lavenduligriseus]